MSFPYPTFPIRLAPSGPELTGNDANDTFLWDPASNQWTVGPAVPGGVVLSGDANGPTAANTVNSLTGTIGGVNVPLEDMSSDALEASFVVRGAAGVGYSTVPVSSLIPATDTAFDFILTSRADVLALPGVGAGPSYLMPAGSYAIKSTFTMQAGEDLQFASGGLVVGMGPTKVIGGNTSNFVRATGGTLHLYDLHINNSGGNGITISGGAQVISHEMAIVASGLGVLQADGGWFDAMSQIAATGNGLQVSEGQVSLIGTRVTGAVALRLTGTNALRAEFDGVFADSTGGHVLSVSNPTTELIIRGGRYNAPDTFSTLRFGGCASAIATAGVELICAGDTPGDCVLLEVDMTNLSIVGAQLNGGGRGVNRSSGNATRCLIADTQFRACQVGILWAAASIPAQGLLVSGAHIDTPTPFSGFTQATAGVNVKCCSDNAGLLAETAIVV